MGGVLGSFCEHNRGRSYPIIIVMLHPKKVLIIVSIIVSLYNVVCVVFLMGRKLRLGVQRKNEERKKTEATRADVMRDLPAPTVQILQERTKDFLVLPQG